MAKILLIEDDRFLSQLLVRKLTDEGFEVIPVYDGESGLNVLKEKEVDLILLDLILPKMHGFDFLRQIKSDPKNKDIPVIILSNLGQRGEVDEGKRLGAADYLIKAHFTPNEIIEKVKRVLKME